MYDDLNALLLGSSSTRAYFISLPVWLQMLLHEKYNHIRTALQLHNIADILLKQNKYLQFSAGDKIQN